MVRKITYTSPVHNFNKLPPPECINAIPLLINEVKGMIKLDFPITEEVIKENNHKVLVFYWNVLKK